MPNLEIYGFSKTEIPKLKKDIFMLFNNDAKILEEMVITEMNSKVSSMFGNPAPFIRLVSTSDKILTPRILIKLRKLNIDIESASLEAFYPKSS